MNEQHDDDLRDAFSRLSAPRSTAGYASREARAGLGAASPGGLRVHSWSRVGAAAAVVVVALGGAVAVIGLRNARQTPSSASAGAVPQARSNAAIAYDSTSGLTVMFGGQGTRAASLADTWTWDGSAWSRASGVSPPALSQPTMADDPADGGVILVGQPAAAGTRSVCGSSGGGSGSAVGSGTSSGGSAVPPATPASVPGSSAPAAIAPVPGATAGGAPTLVTAPATCTPWVPPAEQTWVFNNNGWHRTGGSTPLPAVVVMAAVPGTGQVVAVAPSSGVVGCGSGGMECPSPALGAPTLCQVTPSGGCAQYIASLRTWVWSGGQWTETAALVGEAGAENALVATPGGGGLHLLTVHLAITPFCNNADGGCPSVPPPATPSVKAWTWTGRSWQAAPTPVSTPPAGGTLAAGVGHDLVLTSTGHTWIGGPDGWSEVGYQSAPGGRVGAALGGARDGQFVLFGGTLNNGIGGAPGSDTWVWASGIWRLVSGHPPTAATSIPIHCAPADATGLSCIVNNNAASPPGLPSPPSAAPMTGSPTGA